MREYRRPKLGVHVGVVHEQNEEDRLREPGVPRGPGGPSGGVEVGDLDRRAVFEDVEVVRGEIRDRYARAVRNDHVDVDELYLQRLVEGCGRAAGVFLRRGLTGTQREHQEQGRGSHQNIVCGRDASNTGTHGGLDLPVAAG